ncbi:MAG: Coagulation factor 5/8 type domain protein [Gammaproteobacteria bacterium]|nr:Coagulation factor 5/8 type domain protein [Gammaproteobacteria bacterium]
MAGGLCLTLTGCGGSSSSGAQPAGAGPGSPGTTAPAATAPSITTAPASQTVLAGLTATFTVVASGPGPLTYQWQDNGANIPGATGASYMTAATTAQNSGSSYRVIVTNSAGSITSNAAILTVTSMPGVTPPPSTLPTSNTPDFGPNVQIFDPAEPSANIQAAVDSAFQSQLLSGTAQFGEQRFVFLFKPGSYGPLFANLGYYTTLAGLGLNPDDVSFAKGDMNVDSGWNPGDTANATQNFWRSAENMAITPASGTDRWAVSQAAPMRRMHIRGNLTMGPSNQGQGSGFSSGGFIADSRIDGQVTSGSQQQWYTRDSSMGGWSGGVWNMVFSGVQGAPVQGFPATNKNTVLATTPVSREKPYLYIDGSGQYNIFVPSLRVDASGTTWPNTPGTSIPMSQFYVARPTDKTATLNAALAQGLNLFFTPGVYQLTETLHVTTANTIVTGIGFPTLVPNGGVNALMVDDLDGVKISNLLFDAGTLNSPALLTLGTPGSHVNHAANPSSVQDVFFRIGGAVAGVSTTSLIVNSDDTIIDHIWAWRADHGVVPTGWTINMAANGLIVNGDNVLATGLFVEHYQNYEVLWNGNGGETIFFQNEMPYDPPTQATWRLGANGYAAYKVADGVTSHQGWGMGSYCFFNVNPTIQADRGFEVPVAPGVQFHSLLTVPLGGGMIDNVINSTGGPAQGTSAVPVSVVSFP